MQAGLWEELVSLGVVAEQYARAVAGLLSLTELPRPGRVRQRLYAEGIGYCYLDGRARDRPKRIAEFTAGGAPVFGGPRRPRHS